MSTTAKPQQSTNPAPRPATGPVKSSSKKEQTFLFEKENYMWMIAGIVLIFIGFVLMAGGKSPDPHKFNDAEIYSFRRITLAPIVLMAGFIIEVYAIMKKPKDTQQDALQ